MIRMLLAVAVSLAFGLLPGCSTLRGAARIDDMSADEFAGWRARTALQVQMAAYVALAEEDVSAEALLKVAAALDGLAQGSVAPGAMQLDLKGYGALALALTLSEIDAALAEMGAYGEGWARGRSVLAALAGALRVAAGVPPEPEGEGGGT